MRVTHLSTADSAAGAALATYDLHRSLVDRGFDSSMLVLDKRSDDATVRRATRTRSLRSRIRRYLDPIDSRYRARDRYQPFSNHRTPFFGQLATQMDADIVHLHWINGFVDARDLPSLAKRAPIVWTLHDVNPVTGGCHIPWECTGFSRDCRPCPALHEENSGIAARILEEKLESVRSVPSERLAFVGISEWSVGLARASAVGRTRRIQRIWPQVDPDLFRPRDKRAGRDVLGLPRDKPLVLSGAVNRSAPRKGLRLLGDALEILHGRSDLAVGLMGSGEALDVPFETIDVGPLGDRLLIAAFHSAGDVFVLPSRYEPFGIIGLEAMACGVPVVAFDEGGPRDYVIHEKTGLLARPGDAGSLAEQIERLISSPSLATALGAQARELVVRAFSPEAQVAAYRRLYESMLA